MRPIGTSDQLAQCRRPALGLLREGQGPTPVARQVGTTPQSVCRWRREARAARRKAQRRHRAPGRPSRLSPSQRRRLVVALERGAYAQGYAEDYWTLDRMGRLIWDLFRVRYRPSSVWYLLQRLGWSCQKPQRRSLARDDQAIADWKQFVWPRIKKWHELGATLVFPDETGYSLVSPLKRTWAPRGQTPTIRTSIEHNERLNLIGALCITAGQRRIRLHLHSRRKAMLVVTPSNVSPSLYTTSGLRCESGVTSTS